MNNWIGNDVAKAGDSLCDANDSNILCFSEEMNNFNTVSISMLRHKSRDLLSKRLNTIKVIVSENGYPRDYRGVLQSIGLNEFLPTVQTKPDPMKEILELWLSNHPGSATIHHLRYILGNIDRWDVVDDTNESFIEDSRYIINEQKKALNRSSNIEMNEMNDMNILTTSDVLMAERGLPPTTYDAYLLFHDEDIEFATNVVEKMEECGITLFLKERDLLAGNMESDTTMRIISERCKRLVVLFSNAFFSKQSNLDDFLLKYAQAISIEKRRRKIVPVCINGDCVIPSQFSMYFPLRYREEKLYNFWERLRDSIRNLHEAVPRITITNADEASNMTVSNKQKAIQYQISDKPAVDIPKRYYGQNIEMPKLTASSSDPFKLFLSNVSQFKNLSLSSSRWTISDSIYGSEAESEQHAAELVMMDNYKFCNSSVSLNNSASTLTKKNKTKLSLAKYLSPKLGSKKKLAVASNSSIEPETIVNEKEPQKKWYKRFTRKKRAKTKESVKIV